jgi:hypothetical protein
MVTLNNISTKTMVPLTLKGGVSMGLFGAAADTHHAGHFCGNAPGELGRYVYYAYKGLIKGKDSSFTASNTIKLLDTDTEVWLKVVVS